MKLLFVVLNKLFSLILSTIILFTSTNVYANESKETDVYVNCRDLTVIIDRMMGVTDNMVNSEYINNIDNYIDETIINTYSDYEKGYYNLLYQVYDEYSIIEKANKSFVRTNMSYTGAASNDSFILAALRTKGIIGNDGNEDDYIYIRAREYNYLPRELKGDEIFEYNDKPINREKLKEFIFSFLKSKVTYYYDEYEFLKGNTNPIYETKYYTYFDLLHKKYGFKNLNSAYNYIVSNIEFNYPVKRINMIRELNNLIGYSDELYDSLSKQGKINLPYNINNSDVFTDEDKKAVGFAKLYYLSDYNFGEAWKMIPVVDAGPEEFFINPPLKEALNTRSYTIRAQEFIKYRELKECLIKCLDYKNVKYDLDMVEELFKDVNLDNHICKEEFDLILLKLKE